MSMDYMGDFETGEHYLSDTFGLVIEGIPLKIRFSSYVTVNPVANAIPDVKGLAISRINESVHIIL